MNIVLLILGIVLIIVYIAWLLLGRMELSKMGVLISDVVVIMFCVLIMVGGIWLTNEDAQAGNIESNSEYESEEPVLLEDKTMEETEESPENVSDNEAVTEEVDEVSSSISEEVENTSEENMEETDMSEEDNTVETNVSEEESTVETDMPEEENSDVEEAETDESEKEAETETVEVSESDDNEEQKQAENEETVEE